MTPLDDRRQQFRVASVHAVASSFGLRRIELAEFDPARPHAFVMSSVTVEAGDTGPFAGLHAGDVVEIKVVGLGAM